MSRLINPYQVFYDNSGNVLSSGTLTFYVNGDINTQQNVYSDSALTTTQSNPYTLNAYGQVIGDVWLDGTYTVVVKDSDGSTVRTINDVEDLSATSGGGETVQGSVNNKFINGSCRVESDGGSVSISGSYQESEVDGVYVKAAGTPTNGTADRVKTTLCGTSGYAMEVTDLTTGSGGTVDYRFRFNSVDCRDLVNGAAIFQCNVYQNTAASKSYTISISKATAEDNFTTTSNIGTSSGTSVSDSTNTKISYSIADMGDCSNGIEVIVSCACGAVTTKDFYIGDIVFRKGQAEITFEQEPYDRDYTALKQSVSRLGYLYECNLSLGADTDHDISIASGYAASSSADVIMHNASALVKQIDANWAAGTNQGGFPSGLTLTANTWYYIYLIGKTDGTVDAGYDTSATAANLLTDASAYTYYRAIGAVYTDSGPNIAGFYYTPDIGKGYCDILIQSGLTFPKPPEVSELTYVYIQGAGGAGLSAVSGTAGGDTVFDSIFTAKGGSGTTGGYVGGSVDYAVSYLEYIKISKAGQMGGGSGSANGGGFGGESGLTSVGPCYTNTGVQRDYFYPNITGGDVSSAKDGTMGGGGGGAATSTYNGGGGGGFICLYAYPISAGIVISIGAGGVNGNGGAGDGGDGYVRIFI